MFKLSFCPLLSNTTNLTALNIGFDFSRPFASVQMFIQMSTDITQYQGYETDGNSLFIAIL